jgi:hypothetical protein
MKNGEENQKRIQYKRANIRKSRKRERHFFCRHQEANTIQSPLLVKLSAVVEEPGKW